MKSIEVQVKFLLADDGGRENLPNLCSGTYRPHFVVVGRPKDEYFGVQFIGQQGLLMPDQETIATVQLLYCDVDYSPLRKGVVFKIMEGGNKVGTGSVL